MEISTRKNLIALILSFVAANSFAAAPTMDSFNIQSFLKLSNNQPVTATSADFVFAVFKGTTCIWAKRYSAVAINSGVINQQISGAGTNIASINNASATPGECVNNFMGTTLNATLLNTGATAALSMRIYAETTIDSYKPIWDIPLNTAPTAFSADTANSATTASSADDLAAAKKVTVSAGAADSGKVPILNGSGKLDNSVINQTGLSIANTQVSGLGTASTVNTGTTSGTIPVLGAGGRLNANTMPTYTANKILSTDGAGVITATVSTVNTSAGAGDAGKIPILNGSGQLANSFIDSTTLTPNPANLSTTVPVNKGGTGSASLTANALIVGNGTAAVNTLGSGANGNILLSNGTSWSSTAPNAANIVDMSSTQASIGGNKTFTGNTTLSGTATLSNTTTVNGAMTANSTATFNGTTRANGTFYVGTGGSPLTQILTCTVASSTITTTTTLSQACTGVTSSSVIQCSPDSAPPTSAGKVFVVIPYGTTDTINLRVTDIGTASNWTTGFNCVVFN